VRRLTAQRVLDLQGDALRETLLPGADVQVLPHVVWGRFDEFFTPAFWAARAWQAEPDKYFEPKRLGNTLQEELAACLLGGYGIPAEVGLAAYERVRAQGLLAAKPSADQIEAQLSTPLVIGARRVRYRFSRQKAQQLAKCLELLDVPRFDALLDRDFRDALSTLPGIGPKTASWITRNWRGSDAVAILDVHICRACQVAGVFTTDASPARSYFRLETLFLEFARALQVRASVLDNVMWQTMRRMGHLLRDYSRTRPTTVVPTAKTFVGTRSAVASS
jgi:thermostable 8-oxoguanine DNA glycosylase